MVLQGEPMQVVRQRENDVEVTRVQQFLVARFDPAVTGLRLALIAMPVTAAVVRDERISTALRANIDMTTEGGGAAAPDSLDCLELLDTQRMSVDECVAVRAENVGHLDGGRVHRPFGLRRSGFSPRPGMERASTGLVIDWRCRWDRCR